MCRRLCQSWTAAHGTALSPPMYFWVWASTSLPYLFPGNLTALPVATAPSRTSSKWHLFEWLVLTEGTHQRQRESEQALSMGNDHCSLFSYMSWSFWYTYTCTGCISNFWVWVSNHEVSHVGSGCINQLTMEPAPRILKCRNLLKFWQVGLNLQDVDRLRQCSCCCSSTFPCCCAVFCLPRPLPGLFCLHRSCLLSSLTCCHVSAQGLQEEVPPWLTRSTQVLLAVTVSAW